eukprot:scaffold53042_cov51-Attheya_sp.AAC.1
MQPLGQRRQPVSSFDLTSSVTTSLVDNRHNIVPTTVSSSPSSSLSSSVSTKEVDGAAAETNSEEYKRGLVTIGAITLLFASNSPVMHAALQSSSIMEQPPPVLLINAGVSVVAFLGLLLSGPFLESTIPPPSAFSSISSSSSSTVASDNKEPTNKEEDASVSLLPSLGVSTATRAGVELGLLKFLGTTANLYGLSLTTSDHGAFLIQLTTLIVPVVQGLMGVPIPNRLKQSIGLALAGVFLFTQEGPTATAMSSSSSAVALGDAFCVLAACFYAAYDLRLYKWGKLVAPRELIINKIATQAFFSVALLLAVQSNEAASFLSNYNLNNMETGLGLGVLVLWSGLAVNMLAPFLQVGGQQAVGPTRAQTLYASQPLWAAMMAFVFQGETVGVQGMVGGGAFLSALFLAATAEQAPSSPAAEPTPTSSLNTGTTPTDTLHPSPLASEQ